MGRLINGVNPHVPKPAPSAGEGTSSKENRFALVEEDPSIAQDDSSVHNNSSIMLTD